MRIVGWKSRERSREERGEHTSFRLTTTGASAAVVASPFAVVGCTGFDGNDFAVGLCGSGFGDTASVAIAGKSHRQQSRKEEFDTGNHDEQRCRRKGMRVMLDEILCSEDSRDFLYVLSLFFADSPTCFLVSRTVSVNVASLVRCSRVLAYCGQAVGLCSQQVLVEVCGSYLIALT